jgi:hypothetical protein
MMATTNLFMHAAIVPHHPQDRARALERARILLSSCAEELIRAEAFEPDAEALVDAIDRLLPKVRELVDRWDPPLVDDEIPY